MAVDKGGTMAVLSPRGCTRSPRSVRRRRRRALIRTVAITIAGLIALNTGLEAIHRRSFPSVTRTHGSPVHQAAVAALFPHTYWILIPGFGIDFCSDVEAAYADVLHDSGQSMCIAPSPVALDPAEIATVIRNRIDAERHSPDTPVRLRFYGISMGGLLAYDVATILASSRANIGVELIVFDSSPAGSDSVSGLKQIGPAWGVFVNRLPDLPFDIPNPVKGGPLSRLALHLAETALTNAERGQWSISTDDVSFAWYKSTQVTSRAVANQLDYLGNFRREPNPTALPGAHFAYFRAQDPSRDDTVDVTRAIDSFRTLVAPRDLHVYPILNGSHASANVTSGSYRAALAAAVEDAGILTLTDIARAARQSNRNYPIGP